MEYSDSSKHAALGQIADALGLPVEQFFANPPSMRAGMNSDECLRLWSEIQTDEGRRQALEVLQAIVDLDRARRSNDL